jgi:glycosyltransferase involved in cell wall biosynthesis
MTEHQPKVSAVVATYNREEYIGGAVETVLDQTYDNIELIVVNDGSKDATAKVLSQYEAKEDVVVLHNKANQGISYSRNRAADHAEGKYIAPLDDDDRWYKNKIQRQVEVFENLDEEYCGVYTKADIINKDGNKIGKIANDSYAPDIYPRVLLYCEITPHSSVLLRREHFEEVGCYDVQFPQGVDWDLWIRMGKEYKFKYLSESLTKFRRHESNLSQSEDHERQVRSLIWEKYREEFEEHPDIATNFKVLLNRNKGVHHLENGQRVQALRHFWTALRAKPVAHNFVYLALGFLGPTAFKWAKRVKHQSTAVAHLVKYLRRWEE